MAKPECGINSDTSTTCDDSSTRNPLKILTVGDGDLTLSLSLLRAYGSQIDLIATTLEPSFEDLCHVYANSKAVVEELMAGGCAVEYGIDATKLTSYPKLVEKQGFDLILFHHPHLGLRTLENEQYHAHRHYVLLAHFLASAKALLYNDSQQTFYDGRIGICVTRVQSTTWKLEEASERQGLRLVKDACTARPFHELISDLSLSQSWVNSSSRDEDQSAQTQQHQALPLEDLPTKQEFKAPRRYRNGKLGSMHFLGKYGYMHRRTHGDKHHGREGDMNVQGSRHFFFAIDSVSSARIDENVVSDADRKTAGQYNCTICGASFPSEETLEKHLMAPAFPDLPLSEDSSSQEPQVFGKKIKVADETQSSSTEREEQPSTHQSTLSESERDAILKKFSHSWVVASENNKIRLRRFLQYIAFPNLSRKQNDMLISKSKILVNGQVALDSSRILYGGDVVSTTISKEEQSSTVKVFQSESLDLPVINVYPSAKDVAEHDNNAAFNLPKEYLLVVNKPVGMRNRGNSGVSGALEQIISCKRKRTYKSISSIDTGCSGLVALQLQEGDASASNVSVALEHEFTALVHGQVPLGWDTGITAEVPWKEVRQWRRKVGSKNGVAKEDSGDHNAKQQSSSNEIYIDDESDAEDSDEVGDSGENSRNPGMKGAEYESSKMRRWYMTIRCVERTNQEETQKQDGNNSQQPSTPELCTLKITTSCPISGLCRAICLYLRKVHHPVVGDRKCQREYITLPRSIRNRIKKKLCLGCFQVNIDAKISVVSKDCDAGGGPNQADHKHCWTSSVDIPDKLSAQYWQQHCDNAYSAPTTVIKKRAFPCS